MDPCSASTYISPTHFNPKLKESNPRSIGFLFTPMPIGTITPPTSQYPGDNLPRCGYCGAFINKYCVIDKKNFTCSVCKKTMIFPTNIEVRDIESKSEVYEAYLHSKYMIRLSFRPNDLFIISLNVLKKQPSIIDDLCYTYKNIYEPRQVALAIVHGGITLIRFRPTLGLQTFPDDIPMIKESSYFVSIPLFITYLKSLKKKILNLAQISSNYGLQHISEFALKTGSMFGTSVTMMLDENDYLIASQENLPELSMRSVDHGCEISLFIFKNVSNTNQTTTEQDKNNKLYLQLHDQNTFSTGLDLIISITGGFIKYVEYPSYEYIFRTGMHDCFIFSKGPGGIGLSDFAGEGYLKNENGIVVSKLYSNQTFYLTYDSHNMSSDVMQIAVFYTTELSSRKVRVFTFKLSSLIPYIDKKAIQKYCSAILCNSLIIDGYDRFEKLLKQLEQDFHVDFTLFHEFLEKKTQLIKQKDNFYKPLEYHLKSMELLISLRDGYTLPDTSKSIQSDIGTAVV